MFLSCPADCRAENTENSFECYVRQGTCSLAQILVAKQVSTKVVVDMTATSLVLVLCRAFFFVFLRALIG